MAIRYEQTYNNTWFYSKWKDSVGYCISMRG